MAIYKKIKNRFFKNHNPSKLNFEINENDVFLISYPKSGNTWLRYLIANLIKGEAVEYHELESYIPSIYRSIEKIQSASGPRIIKSHEAGYEKGMKVVYVVRDGRDALVSYYHFLKDVKSYTGSFSEFLNSSLHSESYGSWGQHVLNAIEYKNEAPNNVLILKYEDVKLNSESMLKKVASFIGLQDISDNDIKKAVENSSFNKLKKEQETKGGTTVFKDKKINFFRKGTTEQWKEYFSEEDLNKFIQNNKKALTLIGYD